MKKEEVKVLENTIKKMISKDKTEDVFSFFTNGNWDVKKFAYEFTSKEFCEGCKWLVFTNYNNGEFLLEVELETFDITDSFLSDEDTQLIENIISNLN